MSSAEFQFDSLAAWLAMEGHGPYVWFCVALAVSFALANVLSTRLAHRRFLREAAARARRNASGPDAASTATPTPTTGA